MARNPPHCLLLVSYLLKIASSKIQIIMCRLLVITIVITILSFRTASSKGRVKYLPGFHGPLPFYLEIGYVGVGENEDVQLFYYFIRSESNPNTDPLMLWFTGGPGCSSISSLLYEIGPIKFETVDYNGNIPTIILTPNSWTKMASIIFLDIPVGTGFSYARTTRASYSNEIQLSDHAYEFMKKWFESHTEFLSNLFYVGGDSYSGLSVPIISQLISDGNDVGNEPYINLKGYILGNPLTFPEETNYQIRFANGMGLISDELYELLFHTCGGEYRSEYVSPDNIACLRNLELYEKCIDGIELANILESYCGGRIWLTKQPTHKFLSEHQPLSSSLCRILGYELVYNWLNEDIVQEALHIRKGTIKEWIRCNDDLNFTKVVFDVRPYHLNMSNKGYRSLIYSVIEQWRSWKLNGQIAGYTKSHSNMMTFVTVKGGGHTAPEYKPEECFVMFKRWISNQTL
ncbi:hypothetical protein QVD17_06995 [Tagetes erecta]|uniref:Uncharacterized protein n=1 Tax=Tagetes erecta TaxID=13708 RepID=A0AAD8LLB7_TARER|nr:hypothetical protein QVD17_06995 [Tagetes erecta]